MRRKLVFDGLRKGDGSGCSSSPDGGADVRAAFRKNQARLLVPICLWHNRRMTWLKTLREPIELKDGRLLTRLTDVHELITGLPADRVQSAHWRLTASLLEEAASDSSHEKLRSLHGQLIRALAFDRLL